MFERLRKLAEIVDISADTLDLRSKYLAAGVVTAGSLTDALHVAAATTSRCDFIVSWNFKHIVHFDKVPKYNAVNVLRARAGIRYARLTKGLNVTVSVVACALRAPNAQVVPVRRLRSSGGEMFGGRRLATAVQNRQRKPNNSP